MRVYGVGLHSRDRVRFVDVAEGLFCGDEGTEENSIHQRGRLNAYPQVASYTAKDFVGAEGSAWSTMWPDQALIMEGTYRICWCSGAVRDCNRPDEFRADLGNVSVAGPVSYNTTTSDICTLGHACVLRFGEKSNFGRGDSRENKIVLLGDGYNTPNVCGSRGLLTPIATALRGIQMPTVNQGNGIYELRTATTGLPGTYRVCWIDSSKRNANGTGTAFFDSEVPATEVLVGYF